jgi:hypothetical protein
MAKDRVRQGIPPFQLAVGTSNKRKMYGDEEEEKRQKKTKKEGKKEKNKELRLEFLHSSSTLLEVLMVGMLIYLSV